MLVPKKTGGVRLAIDYRPLNAMTHHDAFPIPNGHELIESLENCTVFSSIDISLFYYQLPLHQDDYHKTAFFACGELFEFRRCPFGLKNAVSYCCRSMREIFKGINGLSIYLDDIVIHAKDVVEHDRILRQVDRS